MSVEEIPTHPFHKIIDRLVAMGWIEDCPRVDYWTFSKKHWECRLIWATTTVRFINHRKKSIY